MFALAAQRNGQQELAKKAVAALRRLARTERGMTFWHLDAWTPFFGWGWAGRVETTALVLQALAAGGDPADSDLIRSTLAYLLRNKDRYGVWYSTQATVQTVTAIVAAIPRTPASHGAHSAEVMVNGRLAGTLMLPGETDLAMPLRLDLSQQLAVGANRISISRPEGGLALAQAVTTWYSPWPERPAPQAGPLRLSVAYDRLIAAPGEKVTCKVTAERIGSFGQGMLLGEIGLPPGADVDRNSLDEAIGASGWAFSRYDVLPDRIVVYLWPRAGGASFQFSFRPRIRLRARTAPSLLYDYYNPEAAVAVAPVLFQVRAAAPPRQPPRPGRHGRDQE
jgi:hypothetical protein